MSSSFASAQVAASGRLRKARAASWGQCMMHHVRRSVSLVTLAKFALASNWNNHWSIGVVEGLNGGILSISDLGLNMTLF